MLVTLAMVKSKQNISFIQQKEPAHPPLLDPRHPPVVYSMLTVFANLLLYYIYILLKHLFL